MGRARDAGAAVLCALGDGAWVAALEAAGARVLELADGRLSGAPPALRLLDPFSSAGEEEPAVAAVAAVRSAREAS